VNRDFEEKVSSQMTICEVIGIREKICERLLLGNPRTKRNMGRRKSALEELE
jgi:hypothetical protein